MFDCDRLVHELSERGIAWADAQGVYDNLDAQTKSLIATVKQAGRDNGLKSEAACETFAYQSKQIKDHLKAVAEAKHEAISNRVRYDSMRTYIDLIRTKASTEREEMKHLGLVS